MSSPAISIRPDLGLVRADEVLAHVDSAVQAISALAGLTRPGRVPSALPESGAPVTYLVRDMPTPLGVELRLEEASEILCVSPSTLRRWADAGRVPMERTDGGHRRFKASDVERFRLALHGTAPEPRLLSAPVRAAPEAADLVASRWEEIARITGREVYSGSLLGWFAREDAQRYLGDWIRLIGEALASGDYACSRRATDRLMVKAHRSGASLVERHLFLERSCEALVRSLARGQADSGTIGAVRRLFGHLAHRHLADESTPADPDRLAHAA